MKLLMTCGASEEFKKFLDGQKIFNAEDFASAATTEEKVTTDIIDVAMSAGVKLDLLSDRSNVRRLWKACRASMNNEANS